MNGCPENLIKSLYLNRDPSKYFYIHQGDASRVDTINDNSDYKTVSASLQTLSFSKSDVDTIWKVVAAIMHLVSLFMFKDFIAGQIIHIIGSSEDLNFMMFSDNVQMLK